MFTYMYLPQEVSCHSSTHSLGCSQPTTSAVEVGHVLRYHQRVTNHSGENIKQLWVETDASVFFIILKPALYTRCTIKIFTNRIQNLVPSWFVHTCLPPSVELSGPGKCTWQFPKSIISNDKHFKLLGKYSWHKMSRCHYVHVGQERICTHGIRCHRCKQYWVLALNVPVNFSGVSVVVVVNLCYPMTESLNGPWLSKL